LRQTAYRPGVPGHRPKPPSTPVPVRWRRELASVLITQDQIAARVRRLTRDIQRDYAGRDLVVVSLLNGTVMFLADLIRNLNLPLRLDFIGVSSYGGGTASRELVFTKELRLDVRGRDVLLVDDILDTGKTLAAVQRKLRALKPRRIRTCVLLDKPDRRIERVPALVPELRRSLRRRLGQEAGCACARSVSASRRRRSGKAAQRSQSEVLA
jgi:hypoxanthine phosphoribosyltransferase